jgi:GNAT superfamily N-acetyltransferase
VGDGGVLPGDQVVQRGQVGGARQADQHGSPGPELGQRPGAQLSYVRSASDRALADISFLITDQFQGRGLGTLPMGAIAIAARRNGIARFCADVLADNAPMRAILDRAGITWELAEAGVVHGCAVVPTLANSASRQARRRHWPPSWTR